MSHKMTLEQVEQFVGQLELQESLQLIARISGRLERLLPDKKREKERMRQARFQLANELLSEVAGVDDDSQGTLDTAETLRLLREESIL